VLPLPRIEEITKERILLSDGRSYRRFVSSGQAEQVRKMLADSVETVRKSAQSAAIIGAAADYSHKPYAATLNKALRGQSAPVTLQGASALREMQDGLSDGIAIFELPESLVLYRATQMKYLTMGKKEVTAVGDFYIDDGFMSSTPIHALANRYSKKYGYDTTLEILLPPGTGRGMYIEQWSWAKKERELLLTDGTGGRIINVRTGNNGLPIVTLLVE
jgi:hypothetical protein